MYETYRMLGEERQADLQREARRLQAGARARGDRARAPRATRKVRRLSGSIGRSLSTYLLGRDRRTSRARDAKPADTFSRGDRVSAEQASADLLAKP